MKDEFSINLAEENESLGFDFQEQYVAGTSVQQTEKQANSKR